MRWIYDIEVYPNLFLLCCRNANKNQLLSFEVSKYRDDRELLKNWINEEVSEMVGFNCLYYDYPVLHCAFTTAWSYKGRRFCDTLYRLSKTIIGGKKIYNRRYIKKQIDLFKINHYDNKAKITSLKMLQFNMQMTNIQELPYDPHKELTEKEIKNVRSYCFNDVYCTYLCYLDSLGEIELREKLSKKYKIDFTNYNTPKIGEWILLSEIMDKLGRDVVYDQENRLRGTLRPCINLDEIILPIVDFNSDEFSRLLIWFKNQKIEGTNSVFTKIPFENLEILEGLYNYNKTCGTQRNLNIVYKDFEFVFGVGGIHGSIESGIYESCDKYQIWDVDVASYYPNLAIKNRFYPGHLGPEFCDVYEDIYNQRKQYKKSEYPLENLALKLALNGAYGKSNSRYSALYDPQYTMKTTINGQLLLCMLAESLLDINDSTLLQINTDGLTIKLPIGYNILAYTSYWEELTGLTLEYNKYSKLIIKDVNNYIAFKDSSVKRKGSAFIYSKGIGELEHHMNHSALVIPKIVSKYYEIGIDNISEDYVLSLVKSHDDVYDFFKRTNLRKGSTLFKRYLNGNEEQVNKVTRYYITGTIEMENGELLIKKMVYQDKKTQEKKSKEIQVEFGYLCKECNLMNSKEEIRSNIYYKYYVDKIIDILTVIKYGKKGKVTKRNTQHIGKKSSREVTISA